MNNILNIIFDFDGTLIDSKPLHNYRYLLTKFPRGSKEHIQATKEFLSHINECHQYNGISDTLEYLKKNDYTIYVLTASTKQNVLAAIKYFGLSQYIDPKNVISSYSVDRNKRITKKNGNPTLFLHLLNKFKLDPRTCLSFGNEVNDTLAAQKANIDAYNCLWGAENEDKKQMIATMKKISIDKPTDIINLLN